MLLAHKDPTTYDRYADRHFEAWFEVSGFLWGAGGRLEAINALHGAFRRHFKAG